MSDKTLEKERQKVLLSLVLLVTALVLTFANIRMVSAQPAQEQAPSRGQFLPLETIEPVYPATAAAQKIEGWAQVKFTVGIDGLVIADSVEIVEAQPEGVFNASAIAAARQFRFTSYAPDGFPVIVPNVQYRFQYQLNDD